MAMSVNSYCIRCKRDFTAIISSNESIPTICNDCKAEEADKEKEIYFLQLDKLSIEERVRKIEEWIYDYSPSVDLNRF